MYKGRREERIRDAEKRRAAREARSDEEQLARLEDRGHGNCKEAKNLRIRIAKKQEEKEEQLRPLREKKEKKEKEEKAAKLFKKKQEVLRKERKRLQTKKRRNSAKRS